MANTVDTEQLATSIRMGEPLTDEQCCRFFEDKHSEAEVMETLNACRKLQKMGMRTSIAWDKDFKVWCLPSQLGKLGD